LPGECQNCGIDILRFCPEEVQIENLLSWINISYEVVGHTKDGKEKKASKLENHETPSSMFIEYLMLCLKEFVFHNYVVRL
jgi:hypothetical protein